MLSLVLATLRLQSAATPFTDFLVVEGVAAGGRIPYAIDPIQQQLVLGGEQWPAEGQKVSGKSWRSVHVEPGKDLSVRNPGGSYAFSSIESDGGVMLLEASGHSMVYVNGVPRGGDVYGFGNVRIPVELRRGRNSFLFALARGPMRAVLSPLKAKHSFNTLDLTLPDIREGDRGDVWIGAIVINGDASPARSLSVRGKLASGRAIVTMLPEIAPMTYRKVPIRIRLDGTEKPGPLPVELDLNGGEDSVRVELAVRRRSESYRRTFISAIDGSVQQYAVQPATTQSPGLALVLSVHGAGVECINQANAYSGKSWCNIVCPTNRRPYGFDWEGIGRADAMEVLRTASKELDPDPQRILLTGHSMGGHGTWQLGTMYPGVFAAIAPSAGWQSFYTYVGKPRPAKDDAMAQLFEQACADTDTGRKLENLRGKPIYILHGDADDNVPVSEARGMRDALEKLGIKVAGYYEQKGAGHWWDGDASPGADCVDWPPMFEMFRSARLGRNPDFRPKRLSGRVWMDVYDHRVAFVYGTAGSLDERNWAYAKARFDAETFAYRGNGSVDVIPDIRLAGWSVSQLRERTVVLYGGPACNRGYSALGVTGVEISSGGGSIDDLPFAGDAGLMALRRGPGGQLVGCVAGTSLPGMRCLDRLGVFTSGTAYPDWTVATPNLLSRGYDGFRAAGSFGRDWKVDRAKSVVR